MRIKTTRNAHYSTSKNDVLKRLDHEYKGKSRIFNKNSDQILPSSKNRKRNNHGKTMETPVKDLTALASFPVIFHEINYNYQPLSLLLPFSSYREAEIHGSDIYYNKLLAFIQEVYTKTSDY